MNRYVSLACLSALALAAASRPATAQDFVSQEVLESDIAPLDVLVGDDLRIGAWGLSAGANPDVFATRVDPDKGGRVCLLARSAAMCRTVMPGEHYDFTIRHQGATYPTRILGLGPQATFPEAYKAASRGTISVAIPEAYELVNIAIALTPFARENEYMTYKKSAYHEEVQRRFGKFASHPFVQWLDAEMRRDRSLYFWHKMNGLAFDFDARGNLVRSPIYESTAWENQPNTLIPELAAMNDFARATGFRKFYAAHKPLYDSQIAFYREDIGAAGMLAWLKDRFGGQSEYDHIKVVFSPLPFGMQSVTWLGDEGFKELQPHMNFPYPMERTGALEGTSDQAMGLLRGELLFTEINHGFINPPAERYASQIAAAVPDLDAWMTPQARSGYGNAQSFFLEMLNWGLIDLYNLDHASEEDFPKLWEWNKQVMVKNRGFLRFREYSDFLVELYRNRAPGTTIPELYPQIVAWFAAHAAAAPAGPEPAPG